MLRIYNSLTRTIEDFEPLHPPTVGMYTCGPTVYDFAHIGNFRTYTTSDILLRTLQYNGYSVNFIMNLTDVGHLTGDNLGDADSGEDRMEKSAKKHGKTAWEVAEFYTNAFLKDFERLNLTQPKLFAKATDHIEEQIVFVKLLEEKGMTYRTSDGIYFDTSLFPQYGKLSSLDQIKEGARVEVNPEKRNAKDFALWKFSQKKEQRHMEWKSPWGIGFPGWHIECSAMSVKYLGESFDIHVGGIDLKETHHPNEIAQAEAVTGKQFVRYWVHGAFMLVDGARMSKSLENNYTVTDLIEKGFHPLALRYLYLQTHYRQEMNFSLQALEAAQTALKELWVKAEVFGNYPDFDVKAQQEPSRIAIRYWEEFTGAMHDDLNTPAALAAVHKGLKEITDEKDLLFFLSHANEVLGLQLVEKGKAYAKEQEEIRNNEPLMVLVKERIALRKQRKFNLADQLRHQIKKMGYDIQDTKSGKTEVRKTESN